MDSLVVEGKVSIYCFVATAMVSLIVFLPGVGVDETIYKRNSLWVYPLHYILINVLLIKIYAENFYSIAWRASLLGFIFAIGLAITKWSDEYIFPFGIYICFLAMFHYSEFLSIAWSNPKSLSTASFILNHSPQYFMGILTSWIEFGLEWWWFPGLKTMSPIIYMGVINCIFGELLRKGAMITAKTNFHHLVQNHKDPNHRLITHGVYNLCRHPSYCGWFIWAVGTQVRIIILYAFF